MDIYHQVIRLTNLAILCQKRVREGSNVAGHLWREESPDTI
jgi:hypothetical protein